MTQITPAPALGRRHGERPVRVAQWATGAVGGECLRGVLDAPQLELVGVLVTDGAKEGIDAGELADRPATGIRATRDPARLVATRPDVVLYTPRRPDAAEVVMLLGAGIHVVTSAFAFHGDRTDAAVRDTLAEACARGGSTLHGTGINPGIYAMHAPLLYSSLTREIRHVGITETADWSVYESTTITFDLCHFGRRPEDVDRGPGSYLAFMEDIFCQQVWLLGDALGADLDDVRVEHSTAVAAERLEVFDRVLEPGTVNGQRYRFVGEQAGAELVAIDCVWTVGPCENDWPAHDHGWTVVLEGDPTVRVHQVQLASLREPRSMEEHIHAASTATAMQLVNSVPGVHAHPPGFATPATLPMPVSLGGFRR